jgi:hypothetical protein
MTPHRLNPFPGFVPPGADTSTSKWMNANTANGHPFMEIAGLEKGFYASTPNQDAANSASMPSYNSSQMWRSEAVRLQRSNTRLEDELAVMKDEKDHAESFLSYTSSRNETLENEAIKLRSDNSNLRAQVNEFLRQQEEWLMAEAEAERTRNQLVTSTQLIKELQGQLSVALNRVKSLEEEQNMGSLLRWVKEERERTEMKRARRFGEQFQEAEHVDEMNTLAEERAKAEQDRQIAAEAARVSRQEKEQKYLYEETISRQDREKRAFELRQEQWKMATLRERERCKRRDEDRWKVDAIMPWTPTRALERLRVLLDEFQNEAFSEEKPLTSGTIPWPVFIDPFQFDLRLVHDEAAEAFFEATRPLMTQEEYQSLTQKVYLSFHPNRWKARGILLSVKDEEERAALNGAGSIVSRAMLAIWEESRK